MIQLVGEAEKASMLSQRRPFSMISAPIAAFFAFCTKSTDEFRVMPLQTSRVVGVLGSNEIGRWVANERRRLFPNSRASFTSKLVSPRQLATFRRKNDFLQK